MKRSPYGGCACKQCRHTRTLWLSWGAPLQWFHGLPSWGGKFSLYLPLLLPQSACFPRLVILWPKNRPHYPVIILRNSCTYTWGLAESEGVDGHQEGSLGVVATCRPHARTHTQTQKTIWVVFPVSSLWQTINTKKEIAFNSETLSPCCTNIWTSPYDQVCIIIHPHQHRRMSGLLPFFPLNCRSSCRDPDLFEHVHFEWTYWLVPSRVYCSSRVGLGLLLRMEKSLLTEGPWWGVLGLSVINKHLTHQGWDSDCC